MEEEFEERDRLINTGGNGYVYLLFRAFATHTHCQRCIILTNPKLIEGYAAVQGTELVAVVQ